MEQKLFESKGVWTDTVARLFDSKGIYAVKVIPPAPLMVITIIGAARKKCLLYTIMTYEEWCIKFHHRIDPSTSWRFGMRDAGAQREVAEQMAKYASYRNKLLTRGGKCVRYFMRANDAKKRFENPKLNQCEAWSKSTGARCRSYAWMVYDGEHICGNHFPYHLLKEGETVEENKATPAGVDAGR